MTSTIFRRTLLHACAAATLAALAQPAAAYAQAQTYAFDIPAQDLGGALRAFARQARQQVVFDGATVAGKTSPALRGRYSAEAGIGLLLEDSGLVATRGGQGALMVRPGAQRAPEPRSERAPNIDEVVVTAQKRGEERLLEVPVPVSATLGRTLVDANQSQLRDYFSKIPGLQISSQSASGQRPGITIRGIPPLGDIPTVGFVVDDVPFGSASVLSAAHQPLPDLDPGDLQRVEVLRGPQGTLYGASGMGGLIKFVTVDPSLSGVSGRVQGGLNAVHNGAQAGYAVRGSVNLPVGDKAAVRASGFARRDPGYVDNPILGQEGINKADVQGGRLSALFLPSPDVSVKVNALYQKVDRDGLNDVLVQPGLGDLEQNYPAGVGYLKAEIQAYSATISARAGGAQLTSITGYNIYTQNDSNDISPTLGAAASQVFGTSTVGFYTQRHTEKFVQELRAAVPFGARADLLVGTFFTHEDTSLKIQGYALDRAGGRLGLYYDRSVPHTYREVAEFANFTYRFTDRFDVQVGARLSQIKQAVSESYRGPYVPAFLRTTSPFIAGYQQAKSNSFTYLVTPRLKLGPDTMAYARFASGFRPGNVNLGISPAALASGVPSQFGPDKTQNYEVGIKSGMLGGRLTVDASLYYITWKSIQLRLLAPLTNVSYTYNSGDARSAGAELSAELRPTDRTQLSGWVAYSDAAVSEDFPANSPTYGRSGDRLPFNARWSGFLSGRQEFPLSAEVTAHVTAEISFVGKRLGLFRGLAAGAPLPRQVFPAYTQTNLRAGVEARRWQFDVYVNNLGDERGIVGGGIDSSPAVPLIYIQPRTVGMTLSRSF